MASRNEKIIIGLGAATAILYILGKGKGGGITPKPPPEGQAAGTIVDVTITGG